jgi:MFS family permease
MIDRRSSQSSEETPLLEDPPPSYHGTDDVDDIALPTEDARPMNNFSRADTIWILAGVWSPVLLGAFDGACEWSCVRRVSLRHGTIGTVVATLLTPIGSQFKASNQASYIGTSYLLSVCCFTPLYGTLVSRTHYVFTLQFPPGRLADILGRKGAMLLALSLFGMSVICFSGGMM